MKHLTAGSLGIVATIVTLSLSASDAGARPKPVVLRTTAMVPDPNGHLLCIVRADSAVQIDVETRIVGTGGQNLLEFGSTLVVSPIGTDDHRYHVEQDAGTTSDDARYCEVSVDRARKNDLRIAVTIESRDAAGTLLESSQMP
jgi:hypothetical protein